LIGARHEERLRKGREQEKRGKEKRLRRETGEQGERDQERGLQFVSDFLHHISVGAARIRSVQSFENHLEGTLARADTERANALRHGELGVVLIELTKRKRRRWRRRTGEER
jgi:hypothetical protein